MALALAACSAGQPAAETTGGQPLAFRSENGVKIFELTVKPVLWLNLDGVTATA